MRHHIPHNSALLLTAMVILIIASVLARVHDMIFPRGHGHPLWYPEPSEGLDGCVREIHLGDVGYLDESGGFRRLFNITVPAEHELNKGGVPDSFTPVTFNPALQRRREKALDPGQLCSEGVERVQIDGTFGADLMVHGGLKIGYTFKCSSHRGAFLDLKDHATKEWVELNPELSDYMRRNHDSWYAFVTDPGKLGLQCSPEDIILVRGTMKTSSWTIGAFPGQTDRSNDIYGGGQVVSVGKARLRMERSHSESQKCVKRSGPGRAPLRRVQSAVSQDLDAMEVDLLDQSQRQDAWPVKDQCIFLSYYKIKYRKLLPKKIVANADPASFDTDDDSTSESSAVLGIDIDIDLDTEHVPPVTPLDDLLDYILECSDAEVAIASDADIQVLYPDGPIPTNLATALRERRPRIAVDNNFHAGQLDVNGGLPNLSDLADYRDRLLMEFELASLSDPADQGESSKEPGCQPIPNYLMEEVTEIYNAASMNKKEKKREPDDKGDIHNSPMSPHDYIPAVYTSSEYMGNTGALPSIPVDFGPDDAASTLPWTRNLDYTDTESVFGPATATTLRESPRAWTPNSFDAPETLEHNSLSLSTSTPYEFVSKDQPPSYVSSGNSESLLDIISRFPDAGHIIPQKRYRPNIQSDRRRYVDEIILEPPIVFYAAHGDTTCGIRCSDALSSRFSALHGRDDPMFVQRGPSVSIRIMWPGYAPWSRQIPTRDFQSPPAPVTRSKLAKNVAKTIKRFIEDMEKKPMDEDADPQYKVGKGHIRIEDLDLLGLEHVSMGSWQALVRLRGRKAESLRPAPSDGLVKLESTEATNKQLEGDVNERPTPESGALDSSSLLRVEWKPFQSDVRANDLNPSSGAFRQLRRGSTPDPEVQAGSSSQANKKDGDLEVNSNATVLRVCTNCSTTNTPVWGRDAQGQLLCNACCLFYKLHGVTRPSSLRADVLKRRNWGTARPHEADVDG